MGRKTQSKSFSIIRREYRSVLIALVFVALAESIGILIRDWVQLTSEFAEGILDTVVILSFVVPVIFVINSYNNQRQKMAEELLKKDRLLQGIADATNILLRTSDYGAAFKEALEILGKVSGVDRIALYENKYCDDSGVDTFTRCFWWYADNTRHDKAPQNTGCEVFTSADLPRWYDKLLKGRVVSGWVEDFPPKEQAYLLQYGVKLLLMVPIFVNDELWGVITFSVCSSAQRWTGIETATLAAAAASFGGAIKRMKDEIALKDALHTDFRQTVQNLQNLVFKLERNEENGLHLTLFEGKIAGEVGLNTEAVFGKKLDDIFPVQTAEYLKVFFEKAFLGEDASFEIEFVKHIYYVTLSPITEDGKVTEVVGSAIDITGHKEAEEQIRYITNYDTLTGLPNRGLFIERVNFALSRLKYGEKMFAIMFLDLDRFKVINDTLGYAAGDKVIQEAVARLRDCVGDHDTISRLGGDEFAILLTNIQHEEYVARLAQVILDAFKKPFLIGAQELFMNLSIGISFYPIDGLNAETLIKNADIALLRVKEHGRNNYQFYTTSMNEKALERLTLESNLRKALERDEFMLYYQPIVDLRTGRIIGAEALVRWKHPVMGMVSPGEFIPLAEETGIIVPIGEWVLRKACTQSKIWCDEGYNGIHISVNISAQHFQKTSLIKDIQKLLADKGLDASCLELEITENSIMQNTNRTIQIMDELKAMGIRISIDDFGTGFSSLGYLKRFAADTLKIDQSFVRDITVDANDAAITTTIINMAHSLNLRVIAEGVETLEQLGFLRAKGCDEMQGYLFSRPVTAEDFGKMLANQKNAASMDNMVFLNRELYSGKKTALNDTEINHGMLIAE